MKRPIIEKNFRSDFDFILRLKSKNGKEIGFPSYDFEGRIYSENHHHPNPFDHHKVYAFSSRGGVTKNCFDDEGRLHIVMNNHHLPPGRLHIELDSFLPNPIYKDGVKKVEDRLTLSIELVDGPGDHDFFIEDEEVTLSYVFYTAYELAKAGGFDGTQEEFNEALAGIALLSEKTQDNRLEIIRLKEKVKYLNRIVNCVDEGIKKLYKHVDESLKRVQKCVDLETERAKRAERELDDRISIAEDNESRDIADLSRRLQSEARRALEAEKKLEERTSALEQGQKDLEQDFKNLDGDVRRSLKRLGDDIYDETKRAKGREDEIVEHVKQLKNFLKNMEEYSESDILSAIN